MEGPIAIGGLILLVILAVWAVVEEARKGAVNKEAAKAMKEVVDATKRFNAARRDSRGLTRRERIQLMLQELRPSDD